jgi:hypothetical protein
MKYIIFVLVLISAIYVSTTDADSTYTVYLEDSSCTSSYISTKGSMDHYSSARSQARCVINESRNQMTCSFKSLEDGSSQGTERFKVKKVDEDKFEVQSKETFTLMQLSLKSGTYSYHFTGFRKFQRKLVTQVCEGKIH